MEKTTKMKGNFDWQIPEVVVSFLQGKDALELFQRLGAVSHNLTYDVSNRLVIGSSNIGVARIDSELRSLGLGIRVANLRDLSRPEVMERIRGRHYADTPVLVFTSSRDDYERNDSIIQQLTELIEEKNGRVELPLLVTGYDYQPEPTNRDYGVRVVARNDFEALHENIFGIKNSGEKFTDVDEKGIPIFDKNGTRTFYTRRGLSRLSVRGGLDLGSGCGNLAISDDIGRVILVSDGEAVGAQNFLAELRKKYEAQQSELEARFGRAVKVLEGEK